mmetsp:Transcript_38208/g.89425  ORF Transcript_38208/g.89425 Transcript_38208/m.89425 type:complete len:85 (-) Transcript_38208:378-632(-)
MIISHHHRRALQKENEQLRGLLEATLRRNEQPPCIVCMDSPRTHALTPCGHKCLCEECAHTYHRQSRSCPICRAPWIRAVKIFE